MTDFETARVTEMQVRHDGMSVLEVAGVGHAPMLDEPGVPERIESFLSHAFHPHNV